MTPEERNLLAQLFDRLAQLENAPRDPEAEAAINDGLRRAPHALYPLVQTVLLQDEALKRADAHIRELEAQLGTGGDGTPPGGGFLESMRGSLFGRRDAPRAGSVPSVPPVRPSDTPRDSMRDARDPRDPWGQAAQQGGQSYPGGGSPGGGDPPGGGNPPGPGAGYGPMGAEPMRPGGSFLGTMAASAAGMIGGSLLMDGMRSMMGHRPGTGSPLDQGSGSAHAATSPWSSTGDGSSGGGNLAQDAGLGDIGRGRDAQDGSGGGQNAGQRSGFLDNSGGDADAADHSNYDDTADADDFGDSDFDDGGDLGGSDDGGP
jgi:hypothetical protein